MAYKLRNIENLIIHLSSQWPVIMLTGARQVGKSTTLKKMFGDKITYVTFDNLDDRHLASKDPKLFFEKYKYPLIIDEFQYVPEILSYIKVIVDELRFNHLNDEKVPDTGLFFLTGSKRWLAMQDIQESLAGRVAILEMFGFSTREINGDDFQLFEPDINVLQKVTNNTRLDIYRLYERIWYGSFPEMYDKKIDKEIFFSSYLDTYMKRDIKELLNIKDEVKFFEFMTVLAARTGQELNMAEVANEVNLSQVTIKEWINVLVGSGILRLIYPYSKNIIKRVVKHPKIYFMDTGLVTYLLKFPNAEILENSNLSGAIFETYVVSEIIKSFVFNGVVGSDLYYYRDNAKREIDIIYDKNNVLYPIEIKKSKMPGKESIKNFSVLRDSNNVVGNGLVICNIDDIYPIDENNYYVPVSYI